MAKDPAFLFYSQDWIVGCQTLSMSERGQYITLICMMHQQGRMDEETIRLLVGSVSVRLLAKFEQDEHGFYYHSRLEKEVLSRKKFVESRRLNGLKGGKPISSKQKKVTKPIGKPNANLSPPLMEDEDVIENEIVNNKKRCEKLNFGTLQQTFSEKWAEWVEFKKTQHNQIYKTLKTEQIAVNKLIRISGGDFGTAEKIINESISNLWVGLFELKDSKNGTTKNTNGSGNQNPGEDKLGRIPVSDLTEFVNRGRIAKL